MIGWVSANRACSIIAGIVAESFVAFALQRDFDATIIYPRKWQLELTKSFVLLRP